MSRGGWLSMPGKDVETGKPAPLEIGDWRLGIGDWRLEIGGLEIGD